MDFGPRFDGFGVFHVVGALAWFTFSALVILALATVLFLLARFLLAGTRAANLYIARHTPADVAAPVASTPPAPTPPAAAPAAESAPPAAAAPSSAATTTEQPVVDGPAAPPATKPRVRKKPAAAPEPPVEPAP